MANTLAVVAPKILAQGLLALRSTAVMPRLVNSDYSAQAAEQGETITIPIPSAIAAQDVTPANTPPSTADIAPTSATISLDQWVEAPFYLDDNDLKKVMNGTMPMMASEAIKSLSDRVNSDLLSNYASFFGATGTAGTTPFGSGVEIASAAELRKVLGQQLAPTSDRRAVLDPIADAAATQLRAFNDTSYSNDSSVITEGLLGRKMGFDWYMDQQVPDHTAGTGSGYLVNSASLSAGDKVVPVDTGTGTFVVGDLVTFVGHNQTYVVTSALSGAGNLAIEPGLVAAPADNSAVTITGDHTANIGFHRDAIGFASRSLLDTADPALGGITRSAVDPVSGLTLRLEITREHKRTRYSYDILYGHATIRRELGARLLG